MDVAMAGAPRTDTTRLMAILHFDPPQMPLCICVFASAYSLMHEMQGSLGQVCMLLTPSLSRLTHIPHTTNRDALQMNIWHHLTGL